MDVLDWILVAIRWGHALAAVSWVGGGIFYLMVLRPAIRRAKGWPADTAQAVGSEFRGLVTTAIAVLLLTGAILTVSRLTEDAITTAYVAVLVVKVTLALYMFYVVRFLRQTSYPVEPAPVQTTSVETGSVETATGRSWWGRASSRVTGTTALLVIGVVVIGLSDVLNALLEDAIAG